MAKKESTKSFLLRLDSATMQMVETWAAQEFRSVNGQLQWIVAEALRRHGRKPKAPPPAAE
ncbi:MAG: DNA-binding protein [Bacteroides sp.]|nr:DNA-binding protein [Bacteroides sp.]